MEESGFCGNPDPEPHFCKAWHGDSPKVSPEAIPKIDDDDPIELMADVCPGLMAIVKCPCEGTAEIFAAPPMFNNHQGFHKGKVWWIIMCLNDGAQWSRERIAEWLETLSLDLSFQVE